MTGTVSSARNIPKVLVPQLYQLPPGQYLTFAKQLYRFCCKSDVKRRHERPGAVPVGYFELIVLYSNLGFLSCSYAEGPVNGGSSNIPFPALHQAVTCQPWLLFLQMLRTVHTQESIAATNFWCSSSFLSTTASISSPMVSHQNLGKDGH
jgi:hypothetical protein